MAQIKSFEAYSRFPQFVAVRSEKGDRPPRKSLSAETAPGNREIGTPCCITLTPPAGGNQNSVGTALLSQRAEDVPRRFAFSVLAIELPPPSALGSYDIYEAVLFEPGLISFVVSLTLTPNYAWAGTLGDISLAFSPSMRVIVRPASTETGGSGEPVLTGSVEACASR